MNSRQNQRLRWPYLTEIADLCAAELARLAEGLSDRQPLIDSLEDIAQIASALRVRLIADLPE